MSATPGLSRRQALKVIAAAVGVTSLNSLPARWQAPVIEVGALPAHAQSSAAVYQVVSVRKLTPCENRGKHHIFIWVRDQAGNGLNGVPVKIQWADTRDGFVIANTETKTDLSGTPQAGRIDFAMFKGNYWVSIYGEPGEVAGPVTPDDAVNEPCGEDQLANSPYHKSFEIIFERI
jgi:hypothetical protein